MIKKNIELLTKLDLFHKKLTLDYFKFHALEQSSGTKFDTILLTVLQAKKSLSRKINEKPGHTWVASVGLWIKDFIEAGFKIFTLSTLSMDKRLQRSP